MVDIASKGRPMAKVEPEEVEMNQLQNHESDSESDIEWHDLLKAEKKLSKSIRKSYI